MTKYYVAVICLLIGLLAFNSCGTITYTDDAYYSYGQSAVVRNRMPPPPIVLPPPRVRPPQPRNYVRRHVRPIPPPRPTYHGGVRW